MYKLDIIFYGLRKFKFRQLSSLAFLLILVFGGFKPAESEITWGERDIIWSDFKGKPKIYSKHAAEIAYAIKLNSVQISKDSLGVKIVAVFLCNDAWTKTASDTALDHERRHFDLVEIYCRKMRKKLHENTNINTTKLNKEVAAIFDSYKKECEKVQKQYDEETNHSLNYTSQLSWNAKIEKELLSLEAYVAPMVLIKLN
jgi:hypothetical protein